MLSQSVPVLLGGDEFARTQHGNNNAYCQDNELTWFDWTAAAEQSVLIDFTARLCRLRAKHSVLRRRQFFRGRPAQDHVRDDLDWYWPDGLAMAPEDWSPAARAITMAMSGATGDHSPPDDPFLLMLNAWWEPLAFTIPVPLRALTWTLVVDTGEPATAGRVVDGGSAVTLVGRSLVLLRGRRADPSREG